jgi:ABC-type Fe3+/spermidine/putrescine transport system ATPase subunit
VTDTPSGSDAHKAGEIAFSGVTKHYPGRERPAVQELSFEVPAGDICVLIGPSGCGKTTALKLVNRLIPMSGGDITIDGRSVNDHEVTELRRGIGYVFQEIGLFPHMTVEDNIGSVPRLLGWDKKRIREFLWQYTQNSHAHLKRTHRMSGPIQDGDATKLRPLVETPDDILVVAAGGRAGAFSCYIPGWGSKRSSQAVTKEVRR